ncbi:MAG: hypothetical protein EPO11_09235 [Gammaproteobacteria bacterium]|nr:MAG: hypothetical protein EPO11_09235 [Gammaproteobacteria bacterium]
MHNPAFNFKPSRCYLSLLVLLVAGSLAIIWCLPFTLIIKLIGLIVVSCYGGWLFWQFGLLRSPHAIVGMVHCQEDKWLVRTPKTTYLAELRGDSTLTRWVCLLRFQPSHRFWAASCLVFRDSLEADHYRQLLIHCRF